MNELHSQIRPYERDDLAPIHELIIAAAEHDSVNPNSTLEHIPSQEELRVTLEAAGGGESGNVLVATDEKTGKVLGYGVIRWWEEDNGTLVYLHTGNVHPDKRRHGVGATLLLSLQERIRDIAAEHSADAPKVYATNASSTDIGTNEMLTKNGYSKFWSLVEMEKTDLTSLEQVKPPEDCKLRPVTTDKDKRAVYEANKKLYKNEPGSTLADEDDYQDFLEDNPDSNLWKVLWKDDEIAGFVLSKIVGKDAAEIVEVSVMPNFQQRGYGKYLMLESMAELTKHGVSEVRLQTDAEDKRGGRRLYERLGFIPLDNKEHYRYRRPVDERT